MVASVRRLREKPFSRRDIASEINFLAPQDSCCITRELFILRSALFCKCQITVPTSRKKIALILQNKTKKIVPCATCSFWEARKAQFSCFFCRAGCPDGKRAFRHSGNQIAQFRASEQKEKHMIIGKCTQQGDVYVGNLYGIGFSIPYVVFSPVSAKQG